MRGDTHTVYTHSEYKYIDYERRHTCLTLVYTTNRVPLLSWIHNILIKIFKFHNKKNVLSKNQDGFNTRNDWSSGNI